MQTHIQLPRSSEEELASSGPESSWLSETDDLQMEKAASKAASQSSTSHSSKLSSETAQFKWLRVRQLRRKLRLAGLSLLPSYIAQRLTGRPPEANGSQKVASLDGLRGLACLFVLNQHLSYTYSQAFLEGWNGGEHRAWIIQLPILRIPWSGHAMVYVFFVISGYVLSYKPCKQMQSDSRDQVFKTISSSIVRRGVRLYLPSCIAIFICMLLVQAGAFEHGRKAYGDGYSLVSANEPPPPRFDTFSEQYWDWWEGAFLKMLYPWTWEDTSQEYDRHLWTIPTEFRCSMLLFLVQCGVARLRTKFRVTALAILVFYCAFTDAENIVLFIIGMLMAQIDVLLRARTETRSWQPMEFAKDNEAPSGVYYRVVSIATFIAGLYLASTPTVHAEDSTGYSYLVNNLVPPWYSSRPYFWQSVGAILVVWSASHSEDAKRVFTNSFAQYLGKISFALYIVHGNINRSVLYAIMPTIRKICGDVDGSDLRFVMAWLMGACLIVPIAFWTADIFWRWVDIPCVKFARWIEGRLSEKEE